MGAAAHALAVGVEDQRGDVGQPVCGHRFGKASLQPLDREARRNLSDEAAGIGKSGLDRDAPAPADIGLIVGLGEQRVEQPTAVLERIVGLEQRRDVDFVIDAEQFGEIERGERCCRHFALGDQHPDRRVCVDVVEDLRHRQELADRGAALDRQCGEVGTMRGGLVERFPQPHHGAAAGEVQLAFGIDHSADRVPELGRVHPEMDPPHAQPVGAHRGGKGLERDRARCLGAARFGFERIDDRGERQQLGRIVRGQPVGGRRQCLRRRKIGGEVGRSRPCIVGRRAQSREQRVCRIDRFQCGDVAFEPGHFLAQPKADRIVPADVGAPVHVVADPSGEAERQRLELVPVVRPAFGSLGKQPGDDRVACLGGVGDRAHRLLVLVHQRDLSPLARRDAARRIDLALLRRGAGDRFALRRGEQERRMRGKHAVELRTLPPRAECRKLVRLGVQRAFETLFVCRQRNRRDQSAQVTRAPLQRLAFELGDHRLESVESNLARFELAREVQRELEHRIEQWGFAGARVVLLEAFDKLRDRAHQPSCAAARAACSTAA